MGFVAAPFVVRLVGQTTSFLRFDNTDAPLIVTYTPGGEEKALEGCQIRYGAPCALVAVNDTLQPSRPSSSTTVRAIGLGRNGDRLAKTPCTL